QFADVAFDQSDAHHPLFEYFTYLDELRERKLDSVEHEAVIRASGRSREDLNERANDAPELPPDIVIITGNITSPKTEEGWQRRSMREAAAALRASLQSARRGLHESVFIVPGSHDIAWDRPAAALDLFADAFSPFAIPAVSAGVASSHVVVTPKDALYAVH